MVELSECHELIHPAVLNERIGQGLELKEKVAELRSAVGGGDV